MSQNLLNLPISELQFLIRKQKISSVELTSQFINRIKKINPKINAVVKTRFDEAIEEAKAADQITKKTDHPRHLPYLHGIPCTIKEAFAVKGMPQTSGLLIRKDYIAKDDAITVKSLRKAGAIIMGITNVSELCMWMETNNKVYGRTKNPHNPTRIVGGSSGGEAAIIAAQGSPFGLASDVGGSIRMPAFFNGICGHKPSSGLVENTGQYPCAHNKAGKYLTTGILCQHASDLYPLMKIIGPPTQKNKNYEWQNPENVKLEELTILNIPDNGFNKVSDDLKKIQLAAANHLYAKGSHLKTRHFEALKKSFMLWAVHMNLANETPFGELMGDGKRIKDFWELTKWFVGSSHHTLPAIGLALLEKFPFRKKDIEKYKKLLSDLKAELKEALGNNGVILYPSYTEPAPKHNSPILKLAPWSYTAIFNVLEFPVTQVPLGFNDKGLPVGIQVASTWGNDHLCMAVGMELENKFRKKPS